MSSKFWTIAKRDYLAVVKSKGFIISTLLIPIFWSIILIVPGLLATYFFEETDVKIAILDKTNKEIGKRIVERRPKNFLSRT